MAFNSTKDITPMLVFAIFSAVLGMFQFGYNTGVINAPQKVLEEFIANVYKNRTGQWMTEELQDLVWSVTVSIFAIGGMLGGLLAPGVSNWCGRKTGLVLNNAVAVIGVTLMSSSQLSQSVECLIAGRFFIGLNCGLNTVLVPMYLTEIATVNLRGALGTVSQLGVTVGMLFSQVLGLKSTLGNKDNWPFLFGFAFVPAILQLIMLPFCPESPRYLLLSCGRVNETRMALRRLRASSDVESDIEEMRAEDRAHQEEVRKYGQLSSIRELISQPWLRAPLIIGIMMQLSQQLSGINAIFYYSTDIFISAEVPENFAVYATMGVGLIMVVMTLISIPLMDKLGRRTLHLYGLAGMFLASIFLTISLLVKFLYDWMKYISVISILFFTVFFGIGPGSIPFMITAELFTQGTRPMAMSVSVLFNWLSNFCVGLAFPLMKRLLQNYLFLPFTFFLAIFWIFTYKKLPETKNRTFEEIAALFKPIRFSNDGDVGLVVGVQGGSSEYPDYGCTLADIDNNRLAGDHLARNNGQLDKRQAQESPRDGMLNHSNSLSQGTLFNNRTQNFSISDQQPLICETRADLCHNKHSDLSQRHRHSHHINSSYTPISFQNQYCTHSHSGAVSGFQHSISDLQNLTDQQAQLSDANIINADCIDRFVGTTTTPFLRLNQNQPSISILRKQSKQADTDSDGLDEQNDEDGEDCVFCCEPNAKCIQDGRHAGEFGQQNTRNELNETRTKPNRTIPFDFDGVRFKPHPPSESEQLIRSRMLT